MTLTPQDAAYVQSIFREYYQTHYLKPYLPPMLERREFGYMLLGQRTMNRHLSYRSFDQLREALQNNAPAHVYRSAAIYRYPEAPMEEKGWMGSELIFDIDADHIETPCKGSHDFSLCTSCWSKASSRICEKCGSSAIQDIKWVCDTCLSTAKMEMLKLLEFMESDFGIPLDKMTLSFSGNRGYHLSIGVEEVMGLGRDARQEIVDYVTGSHLVPELLGLGAGDGDGSAEYSETGWRGRIARESYVLISRLVAGDPAIHSELSAKLGPKAVDTLKSVAPLWHEKPKWNLLGGTKIRRQAVMMALVDMAIRQAGAHVDSVVTTDIHRLLRLSDTLNGKTGLRASVVDPELLEDFDPLKESLFISSRKPTRVRVIYAPEFRLGSGWYGPFQDEEVLLPAHVATYLICRGVATMAKER
ncbi:MAG: DNA primase small subunit domain-containing protein [Nitrososphaerota archaeon]